MINLWVSGDVTTAENGVINVDFVLPAGDYYVKMTSNTTRPIFRTRYGRSGVSSTLVFCDFNSPGGYFQTVTTEEATTYLRFQSGTTGSDSQTGGVSTISDIVIARAVGFNVDLPTNFTCSPTNPYAGNTVTITYSGSIKVDKIVVVGVDTETGVSVTRVNDNKWTFVMPYEDVVVTVSHLPYATIEVIQSDGGTITPDKTIAYDNEVVTLTSTADEDFTLNSIRVTKSAREVELTKIDDTHYQFTVHIQ